MASFEWGPVLPTLAGPRVDLRGLTRQDALAILGIFGDPAVMESWSSPPLENLAGAAELIDEIHDRIFLGLLRTEWPGADAAEPAEPAGRDPRLHSEPRR